MSLWRQTIGLCAALGTAGCGYAVIQGARLFDAPRIYVMPFAEHEPNGLSAPLAQNLSQRLMSAGMSVGDASGEPAAALGGTIHLGNAPSATLRGVQTYAVVAHVHAALTADGGAVLWQRDFSLREEFLPTDPSQDIQPLVSEARRRTALLRLAERSARAVHEAMVLDSFAQTEAESRR
jgi:hypothetical protein